MLVLLMVLSALVTLIFFGALALYLYWIIQLLEAIGGHPNSYLAKLRLGLRAIETETGHLPVQVTQLNQGLIAVAGGLEVADRHLTGTIEAVLQQKGG